MFNDDNIKNTVFKSNMYTSYLPCEKSGQSVIHQFAPSKFSTLLSAELKKQSPLSAELTISKLIRSK